MDECVNSLLKGHVYLRAITIVERAFNELDDLDSRIFLQWRDNNTGAALRVLTYFLGQGDFRDSIWGLPCTWHNLPGIRLYCTLAGFSHRFNLTMIKQLRLRPLLR